MRAPDTDRHIGRAMRHRRRALCLSQSEVADAAGVRFQQIQKYESGVNRVAASTLHCIAHALKVPMDYFFEPQETTQ